MITDIQEIQTILINLLKEQGTVLKITAEEPNKFEVSGTVETMQGKKKVDGIYFSSVIPKPKDVRFYFFPAYTHADQLVPNMPEDLKKCLKGKSCFHIKKLDANLQLSISDLIKSGIKLYKKDGLL